MSKIKRTPVIQCPRIEPVWAGETVVILASGPSQPLEDLDYVSDKGLKSIALNLTLMDAPWVDISYLCDKRVYQILNKDPVYHQFKGVKMVLESAGMLLDDHTITRVARRGSEGFSEDPQYIRTGSNVGFQAIHIAIHMAVKKIILLGYTMKPIKIDGKLAYHNHTRYLRQQWYRPANKTYEQNMIPRFKAFLPIIKERGIEIVNCTPDSALHCFSQAKLRDVI